MDKIKAFKEKFDSLEKKQKITILIGIGLLFVLIMSFLFSENDEKMAKNFSEKRELSVNDTSNTYKNVDFKYDLKEGSIKKDFLKLKKSQEFLLQKLNDISVNGLGGNNINKNLNNDSNEKFVIKSNIFYGYSFINNDEYYISSTGGSVIKSLNGNNNGVQKEDEDAAEVITVNDVTPMIFIYDTNVYTMANGDEYYFSSDKKIKITSKSLFKNIKLEEQYIKEKSIKSIQYKQGTYILIDKYNEIVEEGNFSIYFFKGKKFVLDNGFKNVATPIQNLEIYKPTQKLFKSFKIIDDNVNVIKIENNNLYLNDGLYVKGSEKLFVEEQTHKILITKDKTFYIVRNTFNIGYLEKYIDDLGAIYKLDKNGIILKYNLDGTQETIGNGFILLRSNGEISIKLNNKASILTLDSSFSNKLKIVTCVNTDKKVYIHNKNITIKVKNKITKKYSHASHVFKDDYLFIDNIKICKIKSIVIRNTGNGLELEDGSQIQIHDLNKIDKNKIYVADKDGNRYFEKDGIIYRVNPDGSITKIGKGTINEDGSITMADGTKIDTHFEDKNGNRYIKKNGKLYKINADGSLEEVKTTDTMRIVADKDGNRYFEKDGIIYKINADGSITKIGKGKINADGTITMADGTKIDTFDINDKDLVADDYGNKYFEKDGIIYKINPDGSITKMGKGKINADGTITMADGTKILTKMVKKVVMDKDGNKYFEKNGKIYKIDKNGNLILLGEGKINADGSITMADGTTLDTFKIQDGKSAVDKEGNQYFIKDGIVYKKSKNGLITKMGKGKISKNGVISLADGSTIKTFNTTDSDIIIDEDGNKYYEKDGVIYRINPDGSITKIGKGKINADGTITMADGTIINTKKLNNIVTDKDGNRYFEKDGIIYKINPDGTITKIGKGKINADGSITMADGTKIDTFDIKNQKVVTDKNGNKYFEKDGVIYRINPDGTITKVGKGKINADGSITMADGTKIDTFDLLNKKIVIDKDGNKYFEKDGIIYKINPDGSITRIGKGSINADGSITMADGTKINTKIFRKLVTDKDGNKYFEKDGIIYKINKDGSIEVVGKGKINADGTIEMEDGRRIETFDLTEEDIIVDEDGNRYYEKDGVIYRINKDGTITKVGKGKINADGSITMADGTTINTKKLNKIVVDKDGNKYFEKDGVIYRINPDGSITKIGEGKINADGTISMKDGTKIDTFDIKNQKIFTDKDGNKYFEKDGVIYRVNPDGSITKIGEGRIDKNGNIYLKDGTIIKTFDTDKARYIDKDGNKYFEKDGVIYKIDKNGKITRIGKGRINKNGDIVMEDGSIIKTKSIYKPSNKYNVNFWGEAIFTDSRKDVSITKNNKTIVVKDANIEVKNEEVFVFKYLIFNEKYTDIEEKKKSIFNDYSKYQHLSFDNGVLTLNFDKFKPDFIEDSKIKILGDKLYILKDNVEEYSDIYKNKSNIEFTHYKLENKFLKLFSINDKKILKLGGDYYLLTPNKYIIEINKKQKTISIKEKIARSKISNATVEESGDENSYFKYENGVLRIYQNNKLVKTITDPEEISRYFNMNKETYEYKLDVPTLLNNKLVVYTDTGETIEYIKKGQIQFIKKDGTKIKTPGNIYIQQGDKIILKYKKKTIMFKIKKLIIKSSSIFRTTKGTYAVNRENVIYKSTGNGDFKIQKGFQEAFIRNNIVYISGIDEVKLGEFISISTLKLKLNDNASKLIEIQPVKKEPIRIIQQDNSLNEEVLAKLKALNAEIIKLKAQPKQQIIQVAEKKKIKLFNKDLYDLSDKELDELFKPEVDAEGNPLPVSYTLPGMKSQSISREAKEKLAKQRKKEIKEKNFNSIRLPIGTVIIVTIPSAYEVKTIVGGEEEGGLKTPFIANNIENIKLPDGNILYFPDDAIMRGVLIGDAVTERVNIIPKDIVWYDGDNSQYMQMTIMDSITYSEVENIEGIPGLFINKKIESVVMTSGLQLVSGIAEAIISASSPLASLGGAGDVAGLTGGGAGQDSADKSKVQGAAIGGASKAFDEIIGLIKSDMKKLISFIVTNEEEKIRIIITEDSYTAIR